MVLKYIYIYLTGISWHAEGKKMLVTETTWRQREGSNKHIREASKRGMAHNHLLWFHIYGMSNIRAKSELLVA